MIQEEIQENPPLQHGIIRLRLEFPSEKTSSRYFAINGSLDRDGPELGVDLGDQHFLQDDPPT